MNYRTAIAAALLVITGSASACESVNVTVLPFDVVQDITMPYSKIVELTNGTGEFGYVGVKFTAKVDGCNVTVGYADPVLRVAKEMRRDACSFDHVMEHEQEHVRIYQDALATLPARIQARAGEADLFKAVVQELDAVKVANKAHDNDDEYHTNVTACSGRILRLAGVR